MGERVICLVRPGRELSGNYRLQRNSVTTVEMCPIKSNLVVREFRGNAKVRVAGLIRGPRKQQSGEFFRRAPG
jgi:hypothetical protein